MDHLETSSKLGVSRQTQNRKGKKYASTVCAEQSPIRSAALWLFCDIVERFNNSLI